VLVEGLDHDEIVVTRDEAIDALRELGDSPVDLDLPVV
jgi:hypothetical protein